jgi:Zn-dependent protease with chaperone function
MHLKLILLAAAIAYLSRSLWSTSESAESGSAESVPTWATRWRRTLTAFLLPPLLLLMTAIAVLWMGAQGNMWGLPVGWIGYLLAIGCLGSAAGLLLWRGWQAGRSLRQLQTYPTQALEGAIAHLLDSPKLFAAQVGFWQPRLVISQGLIDRLTPAQLAAVLTHERAHAHYRDTFWFFWLGWLRHLTAWLPQTQPLWQDLLLLRELRADRWAAQQVDPLLLAESLLLTAEDDAIVPDYCAAFSDIAPLTRLEERIDALLTESDSSDHTQYQVEWFSLTGIWVAIVPLLTLLVHRSI